MAAMGGCCAVLSTCTAINDLARGIAVESAAIAFAGLTQVAADSTVDSFLSLFLGPPPT